MFKSLFLVKYIVIILLVLAHFNANTTENKHDSSAKNTNDLAIIAYFHGNASQINHYPIQHLTHLIYSFLHLKGNKIAFDNQQDVNDFKQMLALKKTYPKLKVMFALGGWGGCETCSKVFSSKKGRIEFSKSVKALLVKYDADGIDLDWEYPAIEGYPKHPYQYQDKRNFTLLVSELRLALKDKYEISFAAGASQHFIKNSIEWKRVMPMLNRVHLMTYDYFNAYNKKTGHHTSLYSTKEQKESSDQSVKQLIELGVPAKKIVLGAAFYARIWKNVADVNHGLNQPGLYKENVVYRDFSQYFKDDFSYYWDAKAKAPYYYNKTKQLFATFDNHKSVILKTDYAKKHQLGGIMFWQLREDATSNGLLTSIAKAANIKKELLTK